MGSHEGDIGVEAEGLAEYIRQHASDILGEWQALAGRIPAARKLDRSALIDHIPRLLERIAELVDEIAGGGTPELPTETAEQHALDRLDEGFDLPEVVLEYSLLRECLLRKLEARTAAPEGSGLVLVLNQAIDRAIAASVDRYTYSRERTLQALDRISTAALESKNLDELLQTLLRVLIETTAAVDTAVILLREGEDLRVRAAVGLEEEVVRGFRIRVGEGFAGTIAAEREPKLLRAVSTSALLKSDVIRRRDLRALYGIPLIDGDEVIGVVHIGTLTAFDFSVQDKRLLLALANRTTAALRQHILRDTLEQRERQLQAERARLEAIIEQMPAAVAIAEAPSGRLVLGNKRVEEIWRRPFLPSRSVQDYGEWVGFEPGTGRRLEWNEWAVARAILHGDRVLGQEVEILRGDGTRGVINNNAAPIRDPKGRLIGAVVVFYDTTKQKELERERARLLDEVQRAEQVHRFLSEASRQLAETIEYETTLVNITRLAVPDIADWCVADLVENGKIRRVSIAHADPEKVRMAAELVRRFPLHPDASHGVPRVLRTGRSEWKAEVSDQALAELARDSEHLRIISQLGLRSYVIVPMVAGGRVLGALTLVAAESGRTYTEHDVSVAEELARRAAVSLDNARYHLRTQKAVRTREHLLAVVSHDLRNPLGSIKLSADLLARRAPALGADDRSRKQIENIQRAAGRMEHLILDLLDMASIEAGRLSTEPREVDLVEVLTEAIDPFEPLAKGEGIALRRELPATGIPVRCDRQRIVQAVTNLLGNAVKFCRSGDSIEVRARPGVEDVLVAVSDTGPGIPAGEIPRLFDPYWTAKRRGKKGTGLGLYITKGIVQAHGGRIWVESKLRAGTTFYFTLPRGGSSPTIFPA